MTNDDNALSFKYKANLDGTDRKKKVVKIAVSLKYLSNFWRSLEMPLINCKVELSLKSIENCILSSSGTAATDTKLYVPILTLKTEDNTKLLKLLSKRFKNSFYWNKYKVIDNILVQIATANKERYIRELLDSSYQGVERLFVLAYNNKEGDNKVSVGSFKKYFLPRVKIENYNTKLIEKIFMISQLMTQLNNATKLEKY